MKSKRLILCILCLFLLSGCVEERVHYASVEKKAQTWYRKKYGLKDVSITSSFKAGNSGLFGYIGVADRAYEMSDGYFVYWDDDKETFYDNRQAEEINRDFDEEILSPLLQSIPAEYFVSEYSLNRTGMESFDECVFHELYEGDIISFLKAEKPEPYRLKITLRQKDGFDHEACAEALYRALKPYLSGYMNVCIVNEEASLETDRYSTLKDPDILSYASVSFSDQISWYRKVYIEILDGIYVCSDVADFVLEEGDVLLQEAGKAIELQQILDESYEAMPVDAQENQKGGYMVHDQRHESRYVLNDTDAPYYRLTLSDRVLSALDSDSHLAVYIRNDREDGIGFYVHYGYGTSGSWCLYRVAESGEVNFEYLHPDNLYYFGSYETVKYEEEQTEVNP